MHASPFTAPGMQAREQLTASLRITALLQAQALPINKSLKYSTPRAGTLSVMLPLTHSRCSINTQRYVWKPWRLSELQSTEVL